MQLKITSIISYIIPRWEYTQYLCNFITNIKIFSNAVNFAKYFHSILSPDSDNSRPLAKQELINSYLTINENGVMERPTQDDTAGTKV